MGWFPSAPRESRRGRPARRGATAMVLVAAALVLSGCSMTSDNEFSRAALPKGSSDRTQAIFDLWVWTWVAAGITGVVTFGLIMWAVLRYRRRSDDEIPSQVRYNLPIEVLYTVAPFIVIAVLFFFTVQANQEVEAVEVDGVDHEVTVVGQKWGWTFIYEDEDALGGGTDVYDVGTPADFAELYLPVGESVRFTLESPDVLHSFWVPEFYFKRDVVPGRTSSFDLTPTREGVFRGRCAELCGTYHSRMLFDVRVVDPATFDEHLADLQAADQVGSPTGSPHLVDGLITDGEESD